MDIIIREKYKTINYCVIEFSSMGAEMHIYVDFNNVGYMIDDIGL
jgi:hypothetical protein